MRHLCLIVLLLTAFLAARAQEAPAMLAVAKSMYAIKITDPARQITAFQPVFARVDDLMATIAPGENKATDALNKLATDLAKIPGINAGGDFWLVLLPPQQGAFINNDGLSFGGIAFLLPLQNAQQFTDFVVAAEVPAEVKNAQIFEKYAVISPMPKAPKYAGVDVNVTLQSKRDIVVLAQMSAIPADGLEQLMGLGRDEAGPMAALFGSMTGFLGEILKNQQSVEAGLAMVGDELLLESYVTPVPGSPLAQAIAAHQPSPLPFTLAGYLPDNLAFCSASGPMMEGAPGMGQVVLRVLSGLAGVFMEPERGAAFAKRFDALADQCTSGRAIGLTTPAANLQNGATLVAVYQVKDRQTSAAAMHGFIQETIRAKDALMGGMLTNIIKVFTKENAEMIANTPVDLVKVVIPSGDPTANPAPTPITIEGRMAFLDDKMLIALGEGSKAEITGMITRVKNGTAGFTAGKRFVALKAQLPEGVRGFESYAPLDLCRAGASLAPVAADQKKQLAQFFSIFPAQKSVLSTYQVCRDGRLYGEIRLPGEHLDFACTLIKGIAMFAGAE